MRYTWEEVMEDLNILVPQLRRVERLKNVYGLPRGGLVLAVLLSHHLEIPLILREEEIEKETLIVDDISDTGAQLLKLLTGRDCLTATLFMHSQTSVVPNFFVRVKGEDWISFPWEV